MTICPSYVIWHLAPWAARAPSDLSHLATPLLNLPGYFTPTRILHARYCASWCTRFVDNMHHFLRATQPPGTLSRITTPAVLTLEWTEYPRAERLDENMRRTRRSEKTCSNMACGRRIIAAGFGEN